MPKPRKGEKKNKYVSRCIAHRQGKEGKSEEVAQSAAICHSMFRQEKEVRSSSDKIGKKRKPKK